MCHKAIKYGLLSTFKRLLPLFNYSQKDTIKYLYVQI